MNDIISTNEHVHGTIVVDRAPFEIVLKNTLSCLESLSDQNGTRVNMRPTKARVAQVLRDALSRALHCPVTVKGWDELLTEMKPKFPGPSPRSEQETGDAA